MCLSIALDSSDHVLISYLSQGDLRYAISIVIGPDTDSDGLLDGDGFGNICDPDFDGSGVVNAGDLAILKSFFFNAPGPGGLVP